jgi:hypothetical protein
MTDIERLLAYQEIQQLAYRYAVSLDARDLDALVALFVPDVRVGREKTGRNALRAEFDRSLRAVGITFLNVGSHAIELVDDDHATGIVYTKAELQDGGPDSERWIPPTGRRARRGWGACRACSRLGSCSGSRRARHPSRILPSPKPRTLG